MVIIYDYIGRTDLLVFSNGPVVCSFVWTQFAVVGGQTPIFVLMVNGLLAVFEYFTTGLAGVGALSSVDMLLVFV